MNGRIESFIYYSSRLGFVHYLGRRRQNALSLQIVFMSLKYFLGDSYLQLS